MDIYSQKSKWKWYLAIAGIIIIAISVVYTNYLAGKLAQEEQNKVKNYLMAQEMINDADDEDIDNCDLTLHFELLQANKTVPVILVNDRGGVLEAANFGEERNLDKEFLNKEVERLDAQGFKPIEGLETKVYYKRSTLLNLLTYFPIFQFFLIAIFIGIGYMAFSHARMAEQNQVWVGMAKETAHQLGTPISAIIAWIEHLKIMREGDQEVEEVLQELSNDVKRLDLISDRFSKIGSTPKLDTINIYEELEKCRVYMERRSPRKVEFDFPDPESAPLMTNINPPLFDWVIENLLRNALDAMGAKGKITAKIYEEKDFIAIDLSDTGKGIPASKFKTVFQPGFTTKKRGWGLGLSLAKRIIESYHSGKIFVRLSKINKGTTFTIKLLKAK